ncbi:hypothetical protein B0H14DRAFT_2613964 [Mycena olivaceomarginata]|nr:hypothetical protein B0H14DRAFT_2613964 [Mycena olivaceomarginata]
MNAKVKRFGGSGRVMSRLLQRSAEAQLDLKHHCACRRRSVEGQSGGQVQWRQHGGDPKKATWEEDCHCWGLGPQNTVKWPIVEHLRAMYVTVMIREKAVEPEQYRKRKVESSNGPSTTVKFYRASSRGCEPHRVPVLARFTKSVASLKPASEDLNRSQAWVKKFETRAVPTVDWVIMHRVISWVEAGCMHYEIQGKCFFCLDNSFLLFHLMQNSNFDLNGLGLWLFGAPVTVTRHVWTRCLASKDLPNSIKHENFADATHREDSQAQSGAFRYKEAVARGDVMEVDSEEEEEDEPEDSGESLPHERTARSETQSMALADHLHPFRANVQREEFLTTRII